MAQTHVCRGTATKVTHAGNVIGVTYHNTRVAMVETLPNGVRTVTLHNGGYRTNTTKTRINQFANEFCRGAFNLYQQKGEWFVTKRTERDTPMPFFDGMTFSL